MSDNIEKHGLTRRQFLKTTAVTAAVVAAGDKLFGGPVSSLVASAGAAPAPAGETWVYTSCRECRSHDPIRVKVVNGVAVKIDGIPEEPGTLGRICGRGQAGLMGLYNPYRVKAPMKRTNPERGLGIDPKWQEITWDEALNTVAERIKAARAQDPRQIMFASTFGTMQRGFVGATFGTTNEVGWGPGEFCGGGEHLAWGRVIGDDTMGTDLEACNYYLIFGTNARGLGKGLPAQMRAFTFAKARGMKVVVVDPVQAFDARKADEWIPIRPATDQAFVLAMVRTMIEEYGLVDWEHIRLRTNAPYLIGPDGWYVRSKTETYEDKNRKGTFGKPLVWDKAENKAKVFDDKTIKDYAIDGTYTIDGVQAKPVWVLFRESLKDCTPEWAEKITSVPAATIRRIAKEFGEASQIGSARTLYDDPDGPYTVPYRPVGVGFGKGSQGHYHAQVASRAISLLYVITGAANVIGSTKGSHALTTEPKADPDGVMAPTDINFGAYRFTFPPQRIDQYDMHPLAHSGGTHVAHSLVDPEKYKYQYRVQVLGFNMTNPFKNMYNPGIVEQAMKKVPFIFSIAYHFDEPTEMADIVLPEPSYLERWEFFSDGDDSPRYSFEEYKPYFGKMNYIRQPVVKPLYNTKDSMDIMNEIAARAGQLKEFNNRYNSAMGLKDPYKLDPNTKYLWKDVMDRAYKSIWGDQFGLDWFMKNGWKGTPIKSRKAWYPFTKYPKTRQPIYDEYIKWVGEQFKSDLAKNGVQIRKETLEAYSAFPEWHGLGPIGQAKPEYDMYAVNFQVSLMVMGMAMENPWKYEYNQKFDPFQMGVWINKAVADKKGIKTGDSVVIESQYGYKVTGEAVVTECIHPECVGIPGNYGNRSVNLAPTAREGAHMNTLMGNGEEDIDPAGGNVEGSPHVKISKGQEVRI
jgi:anaerobic selenocysteine-containing dehydrogenase